LHFSQFQLSKQLSNTTYNMTTHKDLCATLQGYCILNEHTTHRITNALNSELIPSHKNSK